MRRRNSAAMMGSVRLKSKSAAFSISAAMLGSADVASEAARRPPATERDLPKSFSWGKLRTGSCSGSFEEEA